MTDYELSNYLPVHGDKLRLRKHLKQEPGKKKRQLLQILHEKRNKAKKGKKKKDNTSSAEEEEEEEEEEEDMRRQFGNRNAVKNTRYIELGWNHQTLFRTKQVRSRTGGGTRKICLRKDSTKQDIL